MLTKLWAYVMRGLRVEFSYKLTFFGRYVGQLVYLLFFYFLSQVVESGSPSLLSEYSERYFGFLLIGGLFSQYLTTSMRQLPIKVRDELMLGSLEATLVTPVPTALALLGPGLWSQIEATFVLAFGLLLGAGVLGADLAATNWLSVVLVTLLSLICLTSWGILSVAFVVLFKRTDPLNWLIGTTISLFSGVYFPISVLPAWLRAFSYLFPLTYSLQMLRAAMLEGAAVTELGWPLFVLALLTIVFLPLSMAILRWAIDRARYSGSLAHY
jgi:ABC-2 type transport system permease protein